jgi:GrpB-like predicted nucleotidyltransferase (UPF0157 family)
LFENILTKNCKNIRIKHKEAYKMVIEEYNEKWIEQYHQIKNVLKNNLSKIINIEHVGSTAITGMWAKPIIDIDVVIENVDDFETTKKELEIIGYLYKGNLGIIGRETFKRNNIIQHKILDTINHHLYVCTEENEELKRHILFRDYLNKHYEIKMEYNNIKQAIIKKYGNEDREKYVTIKETEYKWFFEKVLNQKA